MLARHPYGTGQKTTALVGISRQAAASAAGRPMLKLQPAAVGRRIPRVSDPSPQNTVMFVQLTLR